MEKFSVDPIFDTGLNILQPERGYRFSVDSLILAHQVEAKARQKLIDIGTGSGILPLLLALKYPDLDIIGIEIQKELCQIACQNIADHHPGTRIHIINQDINQTTLQDISGPADIIVSNPPYKKKGTGRLNPHSQKALARHEIHLDINQLFECSKRLLKEHGHLYLVFPAKRLQDLTTAMTCHQFSAKFMRFLHTDSNLPPKRLILCAVNNTLQVCEKKPPIYIS